MTDSKDPNQNTPEHDRPRGDPERAPHDESAEDATLPDESPSDLRETVAGGQPAPGTRFTPPLPEVLGNYRVLGEIGRGGMGSVYAAVRTDDAFKQRVAIKVMRLGLDTEDMLSRFELERQVLGSINHPNIARVYDAGVTPDGRPYFVMELVEGKPIDRYCDDNMLSLQARLTLFTKVCAAVHVAHQNLVVHRDIKPANILVTAKGEPKLLDFGIAKLLNPELAAIDPMTRADQRLLTYEYASPEQVTGDPITTASDVYALGVLLYELLTGHRPYEITKRVYEEAVRVICSTEPQRPSTAVSRAITTRGPGDTVRTITGEEIASRREMQLTRLKRRLSGDLDNIVLKAMRKTPGRRYLSAEDLAGDIDRHLTGQTVSARPPTWDYRAGKFIRRHKSAVAAVGLVALTLVVGITATTWQWTRAEQERAVAERRYDQLRDLAGAFDQIERDIETREGATAARAVIADSLVRTLRSMEVAATGDPQLTLDLVSGYRRAGAIAGGEGGDLGAAREHLEQADSLLQSVPPSLPRRDEESARIDLELARVLDRAGDPADAESRARAAAETAERARPTSPDPIALGVVGVEAYERLAAGLLSRGDPEGAKTAAGRAMELAQSTLELGPDASIAQTAVARAHEITGRIAADIQDHPRAIEAYTSVIDLREPIAGSPDADRENTRLLMAAHERRGRERVKIGAFDAAQDDFDRVRELGERRLADNPFSGRAFEDLARAYESAGDLWYATGELDRALAAYERFVERARRGVELDPVSRQRKRMLALATKKVADVHRLKKNSAEAIGGYRRAVAAYIPLLEADPENTRLRFDELWIGYALGRLLEDAGDVEGARTAFTRGLGAGDFLLTVPDGDRRWPAITAECARGIARQRIERGEGPEAVELLARAQSLRPSSHWTVLDAEAGAFRLIGDADAERSRLERLIDTVGGMDDPDADATSARNAAVARLAELG
jgi:serine/threonine protein kinase/tetratricopeptide (TPR) repeat protein